MNIQDIEETMKEMERFLGRLKELHACSKSFGPKPY